VAFGHGIVQDSVSGIGRASIGCCIDRSPEGDIGSHPPTMKALSSRANDLA
jgi:hypothetical protein